MDDFISQSCDRTRSEITTFLLFSEALHRWAMSPSLHDKHEDSCKTWNRQHKLWGVGEICKTRSEFRYTSVVALGSNEETLKPRIECFDFAWGKTTESSSVLWYTSYNINQWNCFGFINGRWVSCVRASKLGTVRIMGDLSLELSPDMSRFQLWL